MKATLEFTLPEDAEEHRLAIDAPAWAALAEEFSQALRSAVKYGDWAGDEEPPRATDAIVWARELLYEMAEARGLRLT
jgi:hypothetical protein